MSMRFKRASTWHARLGVGAIAAIALALAACGSSGSGSASASGQGNGSNPAGASQSLISQAQKEGDVVLYGAPPITTLQRDAAAFKKAYGINVTFTQLSGGALTTRVNTEISAGQHAVDVVFASDIPSVDKWAANGTLAKLPAPAQTFPGKTEYTAVIQEGGAGLVYNTSMVKPGQVPKTFADLLSPQYKNLIVMGDPATSPAYATTYLMLMNDPAYGSAYFQKLKSQAPRVIGNGDIVETVASGDAAVGFIVFPTNVSAIQQTEKNAPVAFTYLDVLAVIPTVEAILANAPHPAAAQLFAMYMMSRAGQIVNNQGQSASSVLGNLPGASPAPPKSARAQPSAENAAANQTQVINLFHTLY